MPPFAVTLLGLAAEDVLYLLVDKELRRERVQLVFERLEAGYVCLHYTSVLCVMCDCALMVVLSVV